VTPKAVTTIAGVVQCPPRIRVVAPPKASASSPPSVRHRCRGVVGVVDIGHIGPAAPSPLRGPRGLFDPRHRLASGRGAAPRPATSGSRSNGVGTPARPAVPESSSRSPYFAPGIRRPGSTSGAQLDRRRRQSARRSRSRHLTIPGASTGKRSMTRARLVRAGVPRRSTGPDVAGRGAALGRRRDRWPGSKGPRGPEGETVPAGPMCRCRRHRRHRRHRCDADGGLDADAFGGADNADAGADTDDAAMVVTA